MPSVGGPGIRAGTEPQFKVSVGVEVLVRDPADVVDRDAIDSCQYFIESDERLLVERERRQTVKPGAR